MLYTDTSINDVHGRGIIGLGFALGVPIQFGEPDLDRLIDDRSLSTQSVVEMLLRIGAVNTEVPAFANKTTNELKTTRGTIDYRNDWGFGMDLELNVPISEKLGYIIARGQINADFDPNPWFIQLGYTIPLSTFVEGVTGGAK